MEAEQHRISQVLKDGLSRSNSMDGWLRHVWCGLWLALIASPALAWPNEPAADQFTVAAKQYSQSRWELAAEEFRLFLEKYPRHVRAPDARFFLAESLAQLGKLTESQRVLSEFLATDPEHVYAARAHYRLGELAHLANQIDVAEQHLPQFLRSAPRDPLASRASVYLGEIATQRNRLEEAEAHYRRVLTDFPQSTEVNAARLGLAEVAALRGQLPAAVGFLQFVMRQGTPSESLAARVRLGRLWLSQQQFRQAADIWQVVLEDPQAAGWHTEATVAVARFSAQQGDWIDVKARLKPYAHQTDGDWASSVHGLLAAAADELEDADTFADELTILRRQWPHSTWTENALWRALKRSQDDHDPKRTLALTETLLQTFPQSDKLDELNVLRLQLLMQQGDFERVIELAGDRVEEQLAKVSAQLATRRERDALESLDAIATAVAANSELKSIADGLRGIALVAEAEYAAAIPLLKHAIENKPRSIDQSRLHDALMTAFVKLKAWEEAESLRDRWRAKAEEPEERQAYGRAVLKLADELAASGKQSQAAELYKELSSSSDSQIAAAGLAGLAWATFRDDGGDQSIDYFQQMVERYPDHPLAAEATWMRGQALESHERWSSALAMYDLVVERYPESTTVVKALLFGAKLRRKMEQHAEAIARLQTIVDKHADSEYAAIAWYELAWNHRAVGATKQALDAFERVHRDFGESPLWADATYRLARMSVELQDTEATRRWLAALTADRKRAADFWAHAWFLRGQLAGREGKWSEVAAAMEEVLASQPARELQWAAGYWKAEAAFRQQQWESADQTLASLAEELRSGPAPSWRARVDLRRAQIAAHRQEWNAALKAVQQYKQDYGAESEADEIAYLEGRCRLGQGQFQEARQAWERAIEQAEPARNETAAMSQWMIGESYFMQRRYDDAIRAYLRVEALYGYRKWQAAGLLQAGKCYEMKGQWDDAIGLYRQLLDTYPETPHRDEADRRLRVAKQRASGAIVR